MRYFKETLQQPIIFLAGGITSCPDWQAEIIELLRDVQGTLLNPRRANFPIHDPNAAFEQIQWEYIAMNQWADAISFRFSVGSLNPIVLFELGCHSVRLDLYGVPITIFVGVHTDYERRQDVEIQMHLRRPALQIVDTLEALADQITAWIAKYHRWERGEEKNCL
jgi:hypothetical protein